MDTSQDTTPEGSLADQLALSLRMHSLRLNELRDFFRVQKIKMSIEQKTELNEIIDSLSSALNSALLNNVTKTIGDIIASTVKNELLSTCKKIENISERSACNTQSHIASSASSLSTISHTLPKSYSNAVRSTKSRTVKLPVNVDNIYSNKKNVIFVKKSSGREDLTYSEISSLLHRDPAVKVNKIFDNTTNFKIISHDSDSSNKIKEYLEKKIGLEVSNKALYDPCIMISGLPKDLDSDFILQELRFRNGAPEPATKIVRRISPIKSNYDKVIVRSSPGFRESILRYGRVLLSRLLYITEGKY